MRNIFRKGTPKNFKLGTQSEDEDPHQRQTPWLSRSKLKVAQGDASDRCWPIRGEGNVLKTPKLVKKMLPIREQWWARSKIKGQRSRSPGRLMLRLEVPRIFRTERPTILKLGTQMEQKDPYHWQARLPPRSKVKVARSRGSSDRCWPISRE